MNQKKVRRFLSALLAAVMIVSAVPAEGLAMTAYAAETDTQESIDGQKTTDVQDGAGVQKTTDVQEGTNTQGNESTAENTGLCAHHTEHTADCGFTTGSACSHEHTDECYDFVTECVHIHGPECGQAGEETEETGTPETGSPEETDSGEDGGVLSGEVEASDNCTHECSEESGCIVKVLNCGHVHDESCGCAKAQPCGYECMVCPVQELIDALPGAEEITEENAEQVKEQLTAIDEAKAELTDEEFDMLDAARYMAAVEALSALEGQEADEPMLLAGDPLAGIALSLTEDKNGEGWTWECSTKTLTLENCDLEFKGSGFSPPSGTTIILKGNNKIVVGADGNGGTAIFCNNYKSANHVEGSSTLTVKSADGEERGSLYVACHHIESANMTRNGSIQLWGYSGEPEGGYLKFENVDITVGGENNRIGSTNSGHTLIVDNSTITAEKFDDGTPDRDILYSNGNIEIRNHSVVSGSIVNDTDIFATPNGTVSIADSKVDIGVTVSEDRYSYLNNGSINGIRAYDGIAVKNSDITIKMTATEAATGGASHFQGISVGTGDISITGSVVTIETTNNSADNESSYNYGIVNYTTTKGVSITDSQITVNVAGSKQAIGLASVNDLTVINSTVSAAGTTTVVGDYTDEKNPIAPQGVGILASGDTTFTNAIITASGSGEYAGVGIETTSLTADGCTVTATGQCDYFGYGLNVYETASFINKSVITGSAKSNYHAYGLGFDSETGHLIVDNSTVTGIAGDNGSPMEDGFQAIEIYPTTYDFTGVSVVQGTLYDFTEDSAGVAISQSDGNKWVGGTSVISVMTEKITLDKETLSLKEGQSDTLTATITPDNAWAKTVTWSSSDETVATVDEEGKVIAVSEGSATITAVTTDGSNLTASCQVTVTAAVTDVATVTNENGKKETYSYSADGQYTTAAEALKAAFGEAESGDTVTLLTSVEVDNSTSGTVSRKRITLDLAGYGITSIGSSALSVGANAGLTVTDSSENKSGEISGGRYGGISVNGNDSTVTIEGGTVSGTDRGIYVSAENTTINITGGKVTASNVSSGNGIEATQWDSGTVVNVSGGEVGDKDTSARGIYLSSPDSKVTVSDGTVSGVSVGIFFNLTAQGSSLKVTGGTVQARTDSVSGAGISICSAGSECVLSGGTISGGYGVSLSRVKASGEKISLTVKEGAVIAGTEYGIYVSDESVATITGGRVTADNTQNVNGNGFCYGVGVSGKNSELTVSGGEIASQGSPSGSGIIITGKGSKVTITDGTIKSENTSFGEGIDVNSQSENPVVNISGGKITGTREGLSVSENTASVTLTGGVFTGGIQSVYAVTDGGVGGLPDSGYGYYKGDTVSGETLISDSNVLSKNALNAAEGYDTVTVAGLLLQITSQTEGPVELTYGYSEGPELTVTAKKHETLTGDIQYQWYQAGESGDKKLEGETGETLTLPVKLNAGEYQYYCVVSCDGYTVRSDKITVRVNPKPITVTADDKKKTYGDEEPELTYTADGLVEGDTLTAITLERVAGEAANEYTISASQTEGANPNYDITFAEGTFTIAPKELTVTITPNGGTYGNVIPAAAALNGLVNDEDVPVILTYTGTANDGTPYNGTSAPQQAGSYTVTAAIDNQNYQLTGDTTAEFIVSKSEQMEPEVTAGNESISGKNDGSIKDVAYGMEYRKEGESVYIPVGENVTELTGLADGVYYVRYAESANYKASKDAGVTISAGRKLNISVPGAQTGYTLFADKLQSDWHEDVTFTYKLLPGYTETDSFRVMVNGTDITAEIKASGTYMVTDAENDMTVTVQGVADVTAPEATLSVKTVGWKTFLNKMTFGLFFKENVRFTVDAEDAGSGIKTVEYQIRSSAFDTEDAAKTDSGWTALNWENDEKTFDIEDTGKSFVYVRVTDNAGNVMVVSSDGGVVVYTDSAPAAEAVTYTKTTNENVTAELNLNGNTVKAVYNGLEHLDSTAYEVGADGKLTFQHSWLNMLAAGSYTLRVVYNPQGESYGEYKDDAGQNMNDAPAETLITLTVEKAVLTDISAATGGVKQPEAPAPVQSGVTVADGAGYTAALQWDCEAKKYDFNTAYTAELTLTCDEDHRFAETLTGTDGWTIVKNEDGIVTLTKTFDKTALEKIMSVTAPEDVALTVHQPTADDVISELSKTVEVTLETGRTVKLPAEWSCENYNTEPDAVNTFTWTVPDSATDDLYDRNNVTLSGNIAVTNGSNKENTEGTDDKNDGNGGDNVNSSGGSGDTAKDQENAAAQGGARTATGDSANTALWVVLILLAGAGIAGGVIYKKKKKH